MSFIIPNTTQIPHVIIREWMPRLKDIELRILLVVADQTLGWIEDVETGRRKEKDWISHYQLRSRIRKRGNKVAGDRSVSMGLASLVDNLRIIQAMDAEGNQLDSPQKRMQHGGKIYYRLNLRSPDPTLFDTPAKKTGVVEDLLKHRTPPQILRPQKPRATKETLFTKEIPATEKSAASKLQKKDHTVFMDFWYETVKATRGIKPVISGSDGKNLKRVLDSGINESLLEQIALFFLADLSFRKFSPTIQTLCSSGILNGLINRTKNDPEFHRNLNGYVDRYIVRTEKPSYSLTELKAGMQQLASKFAVVSTAHRED